MLTVKTSLSNFVLKIFHFLQDLLVLKKVVQYLLPNLKQSVV